MSGDVDRAVRRVVEGLPAGERAFMLELAGAHRDDLRAASAAEVVEAVTAIVLATRVPGRACISFGRSALRVDFGADGELLDCPVLPRRADGLVTGLSPAERPSAFALVMSLAVHGADIDAGQRDLVSLISSALGDALTRR